MISALNAMMERIELHEKILENQVQLHTRHLTEAYRSAQSATEFKSQLLATFSHEMRTSLNGASCYIELALELTAGQTNNPQLDDFPNNALRCTSDLNQQITQQFDYSENEAKKIESNVITVQPEIILTQAIKTVSPFAKKNHDTLLLGNRASEPITTDREKFSQIILNFMNNAIKFTKRKKRFQVLNLEF